MSAAHQPDYLFRSMQEVDLEAVLQIEPTIYSHPWTRGNFRDSIKAGHQAWVMTERDEIVAYAVMMIILDEAELLNISVAAPYQKQGLGRELLLRVLDQARAINTHNIYLEVRASNIAAIALYERVGFTKTSVRRGYYPATEGREDAILMGLAL